MTNAPKVDRYEETGWAPREQSAAERRVLAVRDLPVSEMLLWMLAKLEAGAVEVAETPGGGMASRWRRGQWMFTPDEEVVVVDRLVRAGVAQWARRKATDAWWLELRDPAG